MLVNRVNLQVPQISVNWSDEIRPGWVPIGLGGRREYAIRWMKAGQSLRLEEPFFEETVRRLRFGQRAPEFDTSVRILENELVHLSPVTPSGIVVHMTRCGSTVLMNALKINTTTMCLNEAEVIDGLLRGAASSGRWARTCSNLAPNLITVFAHCLGDPARKVVIKCGIGGLLQLAMIRKLWPSTPCVILIRNPVDVLVSNIHNPALWMTYFPVSPAGIPPAAAMDGGLVELCAWTIGRLSAGAIGLNDDLCRILDYKDLTAANIVRIASFFGVTLDEGDTHLKRVLGLDAKRLNVAFDAREESKNRAITDEIREAASRWIDAPYHELSASAFMPWKQHRGNK